MNRSRFARAASAALAIIALATAGHARAGVDSFRSSGRCTHLSAALLVDAAAASAMMPNGFVVAQPVPGRGVLALVTQDCVTAIDGGRSTRAVNSVVFVVVDSVQSPGGCQAYDLLWTNSRNDDWHLAMKGIGFEQVLSPRTTLEVAADTIGASASAANPYRHAPFAYTGTAINTVTPPGPLQSVHCYVGSLGLIRSTYDHDFQAGAVVADVSLGRSDLWERLGATDATTAGLFARFTWTGITEIVETN